jgi:hypothetical protein
MPFHKSTPVGCVKIRSAVHCGRHTRLAVKYEGFNCESKQLMLFRVDDGEEPKFSIHSGAELTVFGDFFFLKVG